VHQPFPYRTGLIVVLLLSALLRIKLATLGGQFYWPDESRYGTARGAVAIGAGGDVKGALAALLQTSDHMFFRFLALVPAALERIWPFGDVSDAFGACFFGMFGVGSIYLVWSLVRRETRSESAAFWSSLLYAGLATAFFYSRHYLPYDPAIFLILLGWRVGVAEGSWRTRLLAGAVIGLGYLTYNAYWNFCGIVLVFLVFSPPWQMVRMLHRALSLGIGLIIPILAIYLAGYLVGSDLIANTVTFSRTVTQGAFGRGWWLILTYFYAAEGVLIVLLIALVVAVAGRRIMRGEAVPGAHWLGMALALSGVTILFSDIIHRFVPAGRMVKPIALLFVMGAGPMIAQLLEHRRRGWHLAALVLVAGLAGVNLSRPLRVIFPEEFQIRASEVARAHLIEHPGALLRTYYVRFMHRPVFGPPLPDHEVLLQHPHPLQYRPYLFEGYDEDMRRAFDAQDFSMRLIRLKAAPAWHSAPDLASLDPYMGALGLVLRLPKPPLSNLLPEPLVVSGQHGRADFLSIRYVDDRTIRLFLDHWHVGAVESEPIEVHGHPEQEHHLLICFGGHLPPPDHSYMLQNPKLQPLTRRIIVEWDGRLVLNTEFPGYHVPLSEVAIGANFLGGSTTASDFSGVIQHTVRVDPRRVARREWGVDYPAVMRGGWTPAGFIGHTSGPQEARLHWSQDAPVGVSFPVLTIRAGHETTTAVTGRIEAGGVRLQVTHRGQLLDQSPLLPHPLDLQQIQVSAPEVIPPSEQLAPALHSLAEWLRRHVVVTVNGQDVVKVVVPPVPGETPNAAHVPVHHVWGGRAMAVMEKGGRFPASFLSEQPIESHARSLGQWIFGASWPGSQNEPEALPGPIRLRVRFPEQMAGRAEPLLTAGRPGAGDVIFVIYESDEQLRLAHDHWGSKEVVSEPTRSTEAPTP
jgi:hypothetical protein